MKRTGRITTVSLAVLISFGVSGCSDFIEFKPQPGQTATATPDIQPASPSPTASPSRNSNSSESSEIKEVRANATETLNKIHQLALSEEFEDLLNDPNFSGNPSIDETEIAKRINARHGYFMSELRSVAYISVGAYPSDAETQKPSQTAAAEDLILLNEFYRFTKELKGDNYTFEVGTHGVKKQGTEYYLSSEYVYFRDSQGQIVDTLGKNAQFQLDNKGKRLNLSKTP